jgi:hypothetical protein
VPALSALRRVATLATLVLALAPVAGADAETQASVEPAFSPSTLGVSTRLTLELTLGGGHEGVPPPTRQIVVHLPAGLGIHLGSVATCAPARLAARGPGGCPKRSLIARGSSTVEVHAGSQTIPEHAAVSVVRAPSRGGHPTIAILASGKTPLDQNTLSIGTLSADKAPYGSKLTIAVPPIPSLALEPDASIVSFTITMGTGSPAAAGLVTVPGTCPGGGFPFAVDFGFVDATASTASVSVPCP